MNTVLYNTGILVIIIGLLLQLRRRQQKAEIAGEIGGSRFSIKGNEGFVLMVFGFLLMATASWT